MSIVSVELAGSTTIKRSSDGKRSSTRKWFVYDSDGLELVVDDIVSATGMPLMGQVHPDISGLFASGWDISVSEDRAGAWDVTWNYTSDEPTKGGGGSDDEEADEILPVGISGYSMTIGVTIIDIWTADPTFPASISNPATTDIGGTTVSEGGLPVSMALPTADIRIREKVTGLVTGGQYLSKVGKRNNSSWQGFGAGSVLFTGVNIDHTRDGMNEIEFNLSWDRWYHLRQVPARDDEGNVIVDGSATPTVDVYFKQPFAETTSFSFLPM